MDNKPFLLIIAKDDNMLAQKYFKRKRKVEKVRFELAGGKIKGFVASYVPKENSLVIFVEQDNGNSN